LKFEKEVQMDTFYPSNKFWLQIDLP